MEKSLNNCKKELSVIFKNKEELYKSYMGFLINGGIFVLTDDVFEINDKVLLNIQLEEGGDFYKLKTEVVWKNTNKNIGVGLAFMHDDLSIIIKEQIESILGNDFLNSETSTYTM